MTEHGGEARQSGLAYRASAESGNPHAMFLVADALLKGDGCQPDPVKAADWLRRAAEREHPASELQLGTLYERGLGVGRDLEAAKALYERAGRHGILDAKVNLARLLTEEGNHSAALPLWREAAEAGDASSCFFVGRAYHEGQGTRVDGQQALEWYRKAAEAGIEPATFNLGMLSFFGDIVPQDYGTAHECFSYLAEGGDAEAAYFLGGMFFNGWGVPRDLQKAARFTRQAAEADIARAQIQLADLCQHGQGVEQSAEQSAYWLRRAAQNGDPDARLRLASS